MSLKKKILAVVAVGALTAATAVPALAFENEFHGMFRVKGVMSDIQNAAATQVYFPAPAGDPKLDNPKTRTFIEQRARLMYIAKASDDLKLVTHFEFDYSKFGDSSYAQARNTGAALGADQTNLETKSIYLDFNLPIAVPLNFKVGMQPWVDSYGGLIVNADMAGVLASSKYAGFTNSLGFFRFDDKGGIAGKSSRDFLALDSKFNLTNDIRFGASYYLLNDDTNHTGVTNQTATAASSGPLDPTRVSNNSIVHTIGLNGEAKVGPATITGGVLYQFGNLDYFSYTARTAGAVQSPVAQIGSGHLSAFGGFVGGKLAVGPGTFNIVAVHTSGDGTPSNGNSNAFQSINNTTSSAFSENTFYASNMHILMRSKYEINSGRYLIATSNNFNQGMTVGSLGFDMKFTDKLSGNTNIGFGAVDKTNVSSGTAGSKYLGTEINAEVGYKLYDNLTASLYGAYVQLGNYFKGQGGAAPDKTPNSPYLATAMLNYTF